MESGVQNVSIYRGDNGQLTREWDWGSAYESNSIFTIINPQANPSTAGFPFRLHVTVKIFSHDTVKPTAPEGLTAEAVSSSRMDLRWTDSSDNEESFKINRFWKGSWKLISEVGPNTATFSDTDLPPGRFYSYKVRAYHSQEGNSAHSNVASGKTLKVPPARPGNFTGTVNDAGAVYLEWTDSSDDADHFEILRGADGIDFSHQIIIPAGQTSYLDTNLIPGATYFYKIRAASPGAEEANFTEPLRIDVWVDIPTAIGAIPTGAAPAFLLYAGYPNPFNAATTIRLALPTPGPVGLRIYDISGRPVRDLPGELLTAGQHEMVWDGRDDAGRELASGVYLLRPQLGQKAMTRKVLMLR